MRVVILDENAIVRSAASPTAEIIGELHGGNEVNIVKTVKSGGTAWVGVTLMSGAAGYVAGNIKVCRIRDVLLAQTSVNVVDSPAAGANVKTTYKQGDKFTLAGLVTQDEQKWIKIRTASGETGFIPGTTRIKEMNKTGGSFKDSDYVPFMLGVFLIGGLVALPLTYGLATGLGYFESLPWALASCVVFLISFRRNGTISWGRAIPAIFVLVIGADIYNRSTGRPSFAAGGLLGFLLVMVCGYAGIGIGRMFKKQISF